MLFIKEESEDVKSEDAFRFKHEDKRRKFIKEEREDLRIEEVFSLKDTEEQAARVSAVQGNAGSEAPTLQMHLQNAKQAIELQRQKILYLEDKVKSLTEERNYLRERLEDALILKATSEGVPAQTAAIKKSSTSESSDSSDSESSSSDPKPRKRKMMEKHRERRKKSKKLTSDHFKRVQTPEESITRYYKVLKLVKLGLSKAEAYNRLNVDRNTIVIQAPIAEFAAANLEAFKKLREQFRKGDSIQKFAEICLSHCKLQPNKDIICKMKDANDLLDIHKKIVKKTHAVVWDGC